MAATPRRRAHHVAPTSNGATGYRLSSDDLIAGLEVRTVSLTTLPLELVAELVRMRKLWDGGDEPRFAETLN